MSSDEVGRGRKEGLIRFFALHSIKKWKCPEGSFVHNFSGHDAIINTMSVNDAGVLFSGGALPLAPAVLSLARSPLTLILSRR